MWITFLMKETTVGDGELITSPKEGKFEYSRRNSGFPESPLEERK